MGGQAKKEQVEMDRGAGNDTDMYVAYSSVKSTIVRNDATSDARLAEEDFM